MKKRYGQNGAKKTSEIFDHFKMFLALARQFFKTFIAKRYLCW